jgi:2,3-diaminopropionate biosynthesis protein SbnB
MNNIFSIITAKSIHSIVNKNFNKVYELVKTAYIRHMQNQAVNPPSYFLRFPDKEKSRIIALPASIMQNPRTAGIKWIASNPDNIKSGLKRASAVIILNDYETGYPIACLEGSVISTLRTVYSAILVATLLIPDKRIRSIGIVGAGNIAEQFVMCLKQQDWEISKIKLFDLSLKACVNIQKKLEHIKPAIKVEIVDKLQDLIMTSELIFLATTTAEPYIIESAWFKHNPVILNISLRDLAPEILIASNNIVDDITHVLDANTSPHLTQQKYGHANFINCTVGELINGYDKFDNTKPIVFSPMGMGILDLAVANYIYTEAKASNLCIKITDFYA